MEYYNIKKRIIANMDDSTTKIYDPSAFLNEQMNRIIVMKDDKSVMTDEDVDKVNELKYVLQVDKYDLVNDYNYYLQDDLISTPQAFYEYDSNGFPIEETVEIRYIPTFNDFGNYLKSVTCIKNEKLLAGTMPVNVNDIVICCYGKTLYNDPHDDWGHMVLFDHIEDDDTVLIVDPSPKRNYEYIKKILLQNL